MNVRNSSSDLKRRGYDRDASREAIVSAAMHAFAAHGFAATRVEDVVQAAGYTRGAFYFHFENKLDCFWAVVDHREQMRGDWVAASMEGVEPATASLRDVLGGVFAHFVEVEQGVSAWVLVMVDFFQQHRHDAAVQARLAEVYAKWHDNVARFVRLLQDGGWIAADRDAELLATEVFAYVEGITVHSRLYGIEQEGFPAALIGGIVALLEQT